MNERLIRNILDALNDYDKQKTSEIPKPLEEYINHLAKTGETLFPWLQIRGVLRHKLELVIANFKEVCPTENLPPCPNVEPFKFEIVRDKILQQFDSFTCAPFTIQRLCELLCAPRKHYKRTDKFMRGIEKNLLVVTTVDPEQRKRSESVSSQTLVNGVVDVSVGSSRPLATFGTKNDSRPVSVALDAASVSDADSGISDTEDEDKPSAKQSSLVKAPDIEQQEPSEVRETTSGAADVNEETKPSSNTETESSGPIEPHIATVAMTREEPPTVQMSEDVVVPVAAPTEDDKVEKVLAASSEEESAKSIDVESVATEEKPVEMEEEKLLTNIETDAKEESERIAVEPAQEPQESGITTEEVKPPLPPSETIETPVSDKKRPLEKTISGEDDDSEHSPDAKQPRIFSPDKVIEDDPVPEEKIEPETPIDEEQVTVTKLQETEDKTAEIDAPVPTMESQ
uniref:EOG090X0BWU n=1 Tax=Daphnia hispanica TaxID=575233 RepID=A0A4Y7M2R0_9CRUS|nr:EOG090X0BWU [Daphnia hispanica]